MPVSRTGIISITNGDTHDHIGGDGAQIDHTGCSNIGTKTHANIDTHIAATVTVHNFDASGNAPPQAHASNHIAGGSDLNNPGNLLVGLTPTFTGWNINPATNAELAGELADTLTTSGRQTNSATSYILYDLGSSKRVIIFGFRGAVTASTTFGCLLSDDDTNYYDINTTAGAATPRGIMGLGKCRYIKFSFGPAATGNTIALLRFRVYLI